MFYLGEHSISELGNGNSSISRNSRNSKLKYSREIRTRAVDVLGRYKVRRWDFHRVSFALRDQQPELLIR